MLLAPCAYSQTATYHFEIPAGQLGDALRQFARASGQQVAYDGAIVLGKTSRTVRGRLDAADALDALLEGTGLSASRLDSGVYVIAASPSRLPAKTRDEPVQPANDEQPAEVVIIQGFRASLRTAMNMKKRAVQIHDSIVAEDIGKLPDYNVVEALQRISGLQIGRDHGEGNSLAIRGLTQVKTLINGREIFSDNGRDMAFEYVPTEILSDVDVYKNPSASTVEGGVAGVVNLVTRKPFDSKGPAASLTVRANSYDMVRKTRPQMSALISRRFDTGIGEIGLLLSVADIHSTGRMDSIDVEPFLNRYNLVDFDGDGYFPGTVPPFAGADPGDLVVSPNGGGSTLEITERHRVSTDAVAQWRPNANTEVSLEFTRMTYGYRRDAEVVYANRGGLPAAPGARFTFADGIADDANLVQSGAYGSVAFTSNTNYFDRDTYTNQLSSSLKWTPSPKLKITGDLAYTRSGRDDASGNLRVGNYATASGPVLVFDLRGKLPYLELDGFNFIDRSQYHLIEASHSITVGRGSGLAASLDAVRCFADGPVKSVTVGLRYADHAILGGQGTRQHMSGDLPISVLPEAASPLPYDNFYLGKAGGQLLPPDMRGTSFDLVRDKDRICQAVGDPVCLPSFNPLSTYRGSERTASIYAEMAYAFTIDGKNVTGTIGGRYLNTKLAIQGYRTSNTAQSQPLYQKSSYNNFLPSFNARIAMTDAFYIRLAAARQITRPGFGDLAPNISFTTTAFTTLVGRAGNPELRPLHSDSFDASLEYYFRRNSYSYLSLFKKNVEGFIQTVTQVEPVAFPDYPGFSTAQISRPQNGGKGTINGYEAGLQTFLDFLPQPFDGLGLQVNYTRVDSHAPGAIAGTSVPLVGLSKNSWNLISYYENDRYRFRVAYTYRSSYLDTITGTGSGTLPIYARPFGTLDASFGVQLNKHTDLTIDAANMVRTQFGNYFGNTDRPRFYSIYDKRLGVSLRFTI